MVQMDLYYILCQQIPISLFSMLQLEILTYPIYMLLILGHK